MRDGLLLVGHGTRSAAGVAEFLALAALVAAALPDVAVEAGFLELSQPPAGAALDRLVERGVDRVVVLPALLASAGHAKSDVPAVMLEGADRHPAVAFAYARPLGVDQRLVAVAAQRLAGAGGRPVLLVARGTTDPDANADAYRAARLLYEWLRPPLVEVGFTGVVTPSVTDAIARAACLGATRLAVFSWFLCDGLLLERMRADLGATAVDHVDCGWFGADPALVPVILDRYAEALGAEIRMNCDACAYRLPFPGREDRLGHPVGVGHSHLAASHRHTP